MYHSFLIHLSVDGHLGCFHVLAIINSAVMNTGVHVTFRSGFLGVYAQEWDCWVIWQFYFQFFKEFPQCSPWWLPLKKYNLLKCVSAHLCPTLCDPLTIACQVLLSMELSRQEYWSGLPFPSPIIC